MKPTAHSEIASELTALIHRASQTNLNHIDLNDAGSWPKAGQTVFWLGVVMLIFFLGYYLRLAPALTKLHNAQQTEQQLIQRYKVKTAESALLPAYQRQMKLISQRLRALQGKVPPAKHIPELIAKISEQAQQQRVQLLGLKLHKARLGQGYQVQPLRLEALGSYQQLALFLAELSQLDRIVSLHNFTLQPRGQQLNLSIELHTYYRTPTPVQTSSPDQTSTPEVQNE